LNNLTIKYIEEMKLFERSVIFDPSIVLLVIRSFSVHRGRSHGVHEDVVFAELGDVLFQLLELSLAIFLFILDAEGVELALVSEGLVLSVHDLPFLL